MKYRAVLLDMGGVLIDFLGGRGLPVGLQDWRGKEALLHYLLQRGARMDLDSLEATLFAPWYEEYRRREEMGQDPLWNPHLRRLRRMARVKTHTATLLRLWFRPFAEQLVPLPGVEVALAELKRNGLKMSLVSNVPLPGSLYRDLLRSRGLEQYFDSLHFSYDARSRKPSPVMLRSALGSLGVSPHEAVMVGDRRAVDIAAGRAAGTDTVWIRRDDGGGPQADETIRSLAELPQLVTA
jgi:HAD superfamily hydrolase (TIGR01549 family)